jgi:tryptophan aminotransferase
LTKAVDKGVLALPGSSFFANGRNTAYVRASFTGLPEDQMDEAFRRFASALKD